MWKRLNNPKGARQGPMIGDPVLLETTLDENAYPGLGVHSPTDRNMAPQIPPMGIVEPRALPSLPFKAMPPPPPDHGESMYTSAMNRRPTRDSYATVATTYTTDISPLSSPELGSSKRYNNANASDDDVSPIDDTPGISRLNLGRPDSRPVSSTRQPSSNIPALRREKRRNQATAASNLVIRKDVGDNPQGRPARDSSWDLYSGEIAKSDRGKPLSVRPGAFTPPALRKPRPAWTSLGNESNVSAAQKPYSFEERVRRLKNKNLPIEKPEWRGASGRATLVSPVTDQPDIKPLHIPRKSSRRLASPLMSSSPVSVIRTAETIPASDQTSGKFNPTIEPVLSNSTRNDPRFDSQVFVNPDPVIVPPSATVKTQARGSPNPREFPEAHQQQKHDSTGSIERKFREAFKDSFPDADSDPYVQPSSHFSITTYAPSENQATPRPSADDWDRPPLPTLPQQYTKPSPILNRKRPNLTDDGSKAPVARKAINPSSPVFISMSSAAQNRQSTMSTLSKNLPQSPAEVASRDLLTSLQAQLDNLQHRRSNISRSIKQMTELMPRDNLVVTAEVKRKREMEKLKVDGLREEEADVKRQEHEIGLRLHRAWKRKDKDAVYEPTGLWVRRVTG